MEDNPCRLLLLARLILRDRRARILNGVSKFACGITKDCVAVPIEYGNLVPATQRPLAAFVVEDNSVICPIFVVRDRIFRAPLVEGLDDFRSLRPRSTAFMAAS